MTNRLESTRLRGVAPYVTAGDGGLERTLAVLSALEGAGAACVELGVPFSDPIADGPVLQAAAERALAAGTTVDGILDTVREYRSAGGALPIVLFTYANPLFRRGWGPATRDLAAAGVDGLLVPDLPVEEGAEMRTAALEAGLAPMFFVAPNTSEPRARAAVEASRGFVYAIGRFGVTGAETTLDRDALAFLDRVRSWSDLPLAVGFGLRDREQVAEVLRHADLAIVGSALVQHLHEASDAPRAAAKFLTQLSEGVTA